MNNCHTIISVKQKSQTCVELKVIQKLVQVAHSSLKISVHPRTGYDTPHLPPAEKLGQSGQRVKNYSFSKYRPKVSLS